MLGSYPFLSCHCYSSIGCTCAKLLQLCQILCNPVDSSPPGSSVHGILQGRILEWIAMPSSRGSSWPRDQTCICLLHWQVDSLPPAPPGNPIINYFHQRNQLRFSFWLWCSVYRDICFQILGSWHGICVSFYENLPTSMQSYLPTKRIGKLSLMEIHRVKRMSKPVESVCLCYAMLSCSVVPDPLWPHGL